MVPDCSSSVLSDLFIFGADISWKEAWQALPADFHYLSWPVCHISGHSDDIWGIYAFRGCLCAELSGDAADAAESTDDKGGERKGNRGEDGGRGSESGKKFVFGKYVT